MNQTVAPVHIAGDHAASGFWGVAAWWVLGVCAVALLAWLLARSVRMASHTRRDPLKSAFAKLVRRQHLTRERRDEVRNLAEKTGIPGAVLLVSASARAEAAKRLARLAEG